jgi:ParB-like chromosome segregation protein Spo0J
MTVEKKTLTLEQIRLDGGTQFRLAIDPGTVMRYKEGFEEGDDFPPIEVGFDGKDYWLCAGHHRYHALKMMGAKDTVAAVFKAALPEIRLRALVSNNKHGKQLTDKDREFAVQEVLSWDGYAEKSNYEIAKITGYSQPFIAKVRDPEAKARQDANRQRHNEKKAQNANPITTNPIGSEAPGTNPISSEVSTADNAPDQAEIEANELAHKANEDLMYKLLDSDEPLQEAHAEVVRLNHLNAQLEIRIKGLMNERSDAIKMVKRLQKELDKLKSQK